MGGHVKTFSKNNIFVLNPKTNGEPIEWMGWEKVKLWWWLHRKQSVLRTLIATDEVILGYRLQSQTKPGPNQTISACCHDTERERWSPEVNG